MIRLGNDKPISYELIKVGYYSPWLAELPYPALIQLDGLCKPQPTKGIGIFGGLGVEGSFLGLCRIASRISLVQGLYTAYL